MSWRKHFDFRVSRFFLCDLLFPHLQVLICGLILLIVILCCIICETWWWTAPTKKPSLDDQRPSTDVSNLRFNVVGNLFNSAFLFSWALSHTPPRIGASTSCWSTTSTAIRTPRGRYGIAGWSKLLKFFAFQKFKYYVVWNEMSDFVFYGFKVIEII